MHIAVLDQPVSWSDNEIHEDLKGAFNKIQSYNYYSFDGNKDNHGLNVVGVIAARANNIGIRGIAYESQLYTYGILPPNNSQNLPNLKNSHIAAMKRINQIPEISVVNNSWGTNSLYIEPEYLSTLEKGIQEGFGGKGIVQVRAAGNEGWGEKRNYGSRKQLLRIYPC